MLESSKISYKIGSLKVRNEVREFWISQYYIENFPTSIGCFQDKRTFQPRTLPHKTFQVVDISNYLFQLDVLGPNILKFSVGWIGALKNGFGGGVE